jgi:phospholipid-binding lipoprotein MlaA
MNSVAGTLRAVGLLFAGSLLSGCASGQLPPTQVSDPLEGYNRSVFTLNQTVNQTIVLPLLAGYDLIVPAPIKQGIANGTANLNEPTIFANNLLQGRLPASATTFGRFAINSTLGIGGLFDVATYGGLPKQTGDFGQTLFVWGVNDSPFIMMPFLGPSTVRDAVGYAIDSAASPGGYAIYRVGGQIPSGIIFGLEAVRRAKDLQAVDDSAIDPYVRLRSVYYQTRRRDLLDGLGQRDDAGFDPMITDGALLMMNAPVPPLRGTVRVAPR